MTSPTIFDTVAQEYIHKSKYARYLDDKQRRETWEETVQRYVDFSKEHIAEKYPHAAEAWEEAINELYDGIHKLHTMPSMRLMMTAGEAVKRNNIAAYNCAYTAITKKRDFSDVLLILMHGTGVGFSCERQEINKLPAVPENLEPSEDVIVVKDSKEGWATGLYMLLTHLWNGDIPTMDTHKIRPKGSRLKTFGGRASGPEPLERLFKFVIATFKEAAGRKLTSLEVHDIMCMIADIVVVGGVRRSALISLSNLSDRRMRDAKSGAWWENHGHRALANNSAVYTEKPEAEIFLEEWLSLVKSKSGERGIINRQGLAKQMTRWGRRKATQSVGVNPCSEIILKSREFCNLSEVVVRKHDTLESLEKKVRLAARIGVYQSTLTHFPGIDPQYQVNCEEERLLGVSMTGIMDHPVLNSVSDDACAWLECLRQSAREEAAKWAEVLGIQVSLAITCNKPSGTVAQLTNAGMGGLHPQYAEYYLRTYRQSNNDPLTKFLKSQGVYHEDSFSKPGTDTVFYFPFKAPEGAVTRDARTAIEQLEHWLMFKTHWCEHTASITVFVRDNEWPAVGAWVYDHFDDITGISFLPYDNGTYRQAPFQEITEAEYQDWVVNRAVSIDWEAFQEKDDLTNGSQELACTGGVCSL